ncbi:hypothetical protein P20429_3758 [Pseudoalteromonas sp. BSi20429]|nr:hypothetical protein P20429_3758 [Pseudoalteromonas sp. BSi20429]
MFAVLVFKPAYAADTKLKSAYEKIARIKLCGLFNLGLNTFI